MFHEILSTKPSVIQLWVAGCSTGQEAYSLAIVLLEYLGEPPAPQPSIQILATDLSDTSSLEKARIGWYPTSIETEISPERMRRFFAGEDGGYRIAKMVRDVCVFAKQNVIADPPFSRVNLVSCRNVLICMAESLQ